MFCLPFLGPLHDTHHHLKEDRMHFWIDKRSCVNGRRVPASVSAGRKRRRNKSITPVHRCDSLENGHTSGHIHPCQQPRAVAQQYATPTISYDASRQSQVEVDTRITIENSAEVAPDERIGNASSVKYWVIAILGSVIVFITVSKYYIETQGNKIDISVASSLTLLAAVMMVCILFGYTRYKGPVQDSLSREQVDMSAFGNFTGMEGQQRNDVMALNYMLMDLNLPTPPPNPPVAPVVVPVETEQPPPPYHLAVLLPPRELTVEEEEEPPPNYEKAVVR